MMTHAQAAYLAGRIATMLEAGGYAGKDGFMPVALSNASRWPAKIAVYFRHALPKAIRDKAIAEAMGEFDPPQTPCPVGDQGCFWLGFYHQKSANDVAGGFADRLKAILESAGVTIPQLAEASGLSRQSIHLLLNGERAPSWETVQKLAEALKVPTDSFRS